jgi:lipoate-protein ligase B
MPTTSDIEVIRLGSAVPYAEAHAAQRARRTAVEGGREPEALFLLEHAPVITLGRSAQASHVLASREALEGLGVAVAETDRGGDVTYHGPGQLVAYPIIDLELRGLTITRYLRLLEGAVIDTLADFGVKGERLDGYTGVWVGGAKVAAIGVAIHRGVTFHGAAINVCPDMTQWRLIVPCGIADKPVTSLQQLLPEAPSTESVADAFARAFSRRLNAEIELPGISQKFEAKS